MVELNINSTIYILNGGSTVNTKPTFASNKIKFFHNIISSLCVIIFIWSGRWDSNPRHSDWKSEALPTELHPHILLMAPEVGLEPTTQRLTVACSTN
ncbi:MAG: AMP-binding enzyme family protein [Caudoviricetes sp.]|nr:MAG: AMP-binding enzyme family protein [Caudoviricetes sp.]